MKVYSGDVENISTHVPRAGDDVRIILRVAHFALISTHVPRAGDD